MAWLKALATQARDASGPGAGGTARLAAMLTVAVLVGLAGRPPATGAADVHGAGTPCRSTHRAPVRLVADASGGTEAVFSLAGGSLRGTVPVPEPAARELSAHGDLHVTDVQLGSYELDAPGGPIACRLDPTYHFYCPATDTLDQLCIEWNGAASTSARWPS